MSLSLQDKHILVTAGANGIGLAIVRVLASGARVHACDVDADACRALAGSHPNLSVSVADVSSEAQVLDLYRDLAERWGRLDALVNNAGVAGPTSRLEDTTLDAWRQTLDVNLTGASCARAARCRCARPAAAPSSISRRWRAGSASLRTPYSASKFGLAGLTQTWAMELGPSNIRVNSVLPGVVAGERVERVIAARAAAGGVSNDAMRAQLVSSVSLRRMTQPEDVANQVAFLCSDEGAMISGQSISVCGNVEHLG